MSLVRRFDGTSANPGFCIYVLISFRASLQRLPFCSRSSYFVCSSTFATISTPRTNWKAVTMSAEGYTRVYVGGLNEGIKKEDLQVEFEKYGKLNKVWVAFNPPGFAFIEFLNEDEAEVACDNMNGTEIMGAKLRVEISRGRGRGGSRGGSGGFRGGRGGSGGSRGFGSRGGNGGGYRGGSSSYGDRGGGYRGSRGGGGGRGRGRFGDDYSSSRSSGGGYGSRDSYSRDSYGSSGGGGGGGSGSDYYSGRDNGSSRYRSRSPAGRGSHRHLRECT